MYRGRISRVRMDAEGSTLADVDRALDEGFGIVTRALERAVDAGSLRSDDGPLLHPRESEFVENVVESKVREDGGAIYHVGRRVVKYNEPDPVEFVGVLSEFESAEKLLDELRDFPEIGFSVQPLIERNAGDPRWRVIVSADFGPGGSDLDVRRVRLYDAAKETLEELRRIAPPVTVEPGEAEDRISVR